MHQIFKHKHKANGQEWAQKKREAELQKETRIGYAQQALAQQLQQQAGVEMDSLVSELKNSLKITEKNGYSYIYGTGDATTVYAEDNDITKEVVKELNEISIKLLLKQMLKKRQKAEEKK
jgi:outer membrane protein